MKEIELFPSKKVKLPDAKIAGLFYPGTYEESLMNLGFQAVYSILSESSDWYCERFYHSFKDGLQSIDLSMQLTMMDAVFVTLGWEPHIFNLLDSLSKGNILWKNKRSIPVIIGGVLSDTQCLKSLDDFIDYLYNGEAEVGFENILEELAHCENYKEYFNRICNTEFRMQDMSETRSYSRIISLSGHSHFKSSFLISVMRGCVNSCKFCLLGCGKTRSLFLEFNRFKKLLDPVIARKDVTSIGLVGTSPTQNPYFLEYLEYIVKHGKKIGFSSLRIGNKIISDLLPYLKQSTHKTLTFAPDAFSDRLGKEIGKPIPFSALLAMIVKLTEHGFFNFKLYYMIGLPTETQKDVEELVTNIKHLLKNKSIHLKLSFSHFVPKSGTVMNECNFTSRKIVKQRINYIKKQLKIRDIYVESNSDTIVQAAFSKFPELVITELVKQKFRFPERSDLKSFEKLLLT